MNFILNLLSKNIFFQNIPKDIILRILNSPACYIKSFDPEMNIYEIGEEIHYAGIILEGIVDIIHTSIKGDETIVNRLTKGQILGSSFSFVSNINNLNYIRSTTASTILFVNINKLLQECDFISDYRICLLENIMRSLAQSNILLNAKVQILSQKSLRDKLLTYFELLASQEGSNKITIPFNREQLACFIGSERSSVCRELSKLQADNLISIKQNHVVLLSTAV